MYSFVLTAGGVWNSHADWHFSIYKLSVPVEISISSRNVRSSGERNNRAVEKIIKKMINLSYQNKIIAVPAGEDVNNLIVPALVFR